jgi:pyrroloquinoline-quinone synthase
MNTEAFLDQLDACIAKHDLLCHPFYQAWSAGRLTREDLGEYAGDYYHHVEAFPTYLAELSIRLEEGELRRAVLANMEDELGAKTPAGDRERSHAELWLDFAEGMGTGRNRAARPPIAEVHELTNYFHCMASWGTPEEALASFYAYESQVPRVAREKARGLKDFYGAGEKTFGYFTLHATADVHHSGVWRQQLARRLEANPEAAEKALEAAEGAAKALWRALDGIEARRMAQAM